MERKLVKVMFAIPNEGHTEPEAYDDRMCMSFRLGVLEVLSGLGMSEWEGHHFEYPENERFKFYISSVGKVFTALARERIAEYALSAGVDYLFMIDDDMICPVDIFERLYRHNVDIVAPIAFTRYAPHKPVIYNLMRGFDHFEKKEFYINHAVLDYPRDTLVQCDAIGFGAVLIKSRVLRSLNKPWFMTTSGAGEDIHFCHSAGKAGFKIYCDTSTKLGHLGTPHLITEETFDTPENQLALGHK